MGLLNVGCGVFLFIFVFSLVSLSTTKREMSASDVYFTDSRDFSNGFS